MQPDFCARQGYTWQTRLSLCESSYAENKGVIRSEISCLRFSNESQKFGSRICLWCTHQLCKDEVTKLLIVCPWINGLTAQFYSFWKSPTDDGIVRWTGLEVLTQLFHRTFSIILIAFNVSWQSCVAYTASVGNSVLSLTQDSGGLWSFSKLRQRQKLFLQSWGMTSTYMPTVPISRPSGRSRFEESNPTSRPMTKKRWLLPICIDKQLKHAVKHKPGFSLPRLWIRRNFEKRALLFFHIFVFHVDLGCHPHTYFTCGVSFA